MERTIVGAFLALGFFGQYIKVHPTGRWRCYPERVASMKTALPPPGPSRCEPDEEGPDGMERH